MAERTGYPLFHRRQAACSLQLCYDRGFAELFSQPLGTAIHVDFGGGKLFHRVRSSGRQQALARAIGLDRNPRLHIIDATAGLATDAFVLASLGAKITLLEQSPVVCALLDDAIRRARNNDTLRALFDDNFHLHQTDSRHYLQALPENARPDVIYLDPMFPQRKKSALVKKEMQILQQLHGEAESTDSLLATACRCARRRVVVKRPSDAPPLGERQLGAVIRSKKMRYDIYSFRRMEDDEETKP